MPSSAGTGLWLPDVGGLDLYLTFVSTCEEPSIGGLSRTQPAALAAASRLASESGGTLAPLVFEDGVLLVVAVLSPPPPLPETTITTTTTTAMVSSAPRRNWRRRARVWPAAWAASAASRSSRRFRFSSSLLAMGAAG